MLRLLLLLGVFLGVGCGGKKDRTLVVGMDLSYPPFETIDGSGQPMGVSVDLARALAESLGRPLRIENIPFVGLLPSLQNGRIDCIISSMTDTPERRKVVLFSDPYLSTGLAILARKGGAGSLEELDQPGQTVAVRLGTTGEAWAREHIHRAKVVSLEKESTAVLEVIQGKADGFLYDQMSVWQNHRKNPDTTRALLSPIREEKWAIAFRPGDTTLQEQVNAFLATFRAQGGFERLGDRYLKDQKAAFAQERVPFVF